MLIMDYGDTRVKDFLSEYSAILIGLLLGSLAHFGRLFEEGRMPSLAQILGFLMQLGVVGLASLVVTKRLGISDSDLRALTTAIFSMSANEVVQFLRRRTWLQLHRALLISFGNPKDDD